MLNFKNPCDRDHIQSLHENLIHYTNEGNEEVAELFRGFIKETERVCGVVKRNVVPQSNSITLKPPEERKPEGFRGMLDSAFPEPAEKEPQPPVRTAMSGFERMVEASQFGGAQTTVQSAIISQKEKAVIRGMTKREQRALLQDGLKRIERRVSGAISKMVLGESSRVKKQPARSPQRRMPIGFRAALDVIYSSPTEEKRMLAKNPPKSKIFDWMRTNIKSQPIKSLDQLAEGESIVTMQNFKQIKITRRNGRLVTSSVREKPTEENVKILPLLQDGESRIVQRGFFRKMLIPRKGNKIISSYL